MAKLGGFRELPLPTANLAVATARASQQKTGASPQKPLLLAAAPTKLLPAAGAGNKAGASGDAGEPWRECLAKFAGSEAASREALRNELRAFARQLNEPPPDELGPSAGADVQVAVPLGNNDAAAAGAQRPSIPSRPPAFVVFARQSDEPAG